MRRVESKFFVLFFIHLPELIRGLSRYTRNKLSDLIDRAGPLLMFGPFLVRGKTDITPLGLTLLLALSLFMVGGPVVSLLTLAFGLMGAAFGLLGLSALDILHSYLSGGEPLPGVGPVIPGVQIGPYYIPFLEGWLSILLIFLIHEGAHGIVALRRRIPLTDAGIVLLGPIPVAAYVSPDEEKFLSASPQDKLHVLAAGPAANVLAYIPVALLLLLIAQPLSTVFDHYYRTYGLGVEVLSVPETVEINGKTLPSLVYGIISPGDVIVSVNGRRVYTVRDIVEALQNAKGDYVEVEYISNGEKKVISIPNKGYLGIEGGKTVWRESPPLEYRILYFLVSFLAVFSTLNLMIAVVNALPFSVLDGGQGIEELKKLGGPDPRPLKDLALLLLLINVLPWFT